MHRGNIQFAALFIWISFAGDPAFAKDQANLPAPGSTTSDGFTVSALWHVDYKTSWVNHGAIGVRGETYGGCPTGHPADTVEETTGHTDVSEEVNEQTGQQRAVVKSGEWRYKWDYQACHHLSSKADGGFQHPVIVHDVRDGKAMVHFVVWMAEPPNRQEVRGGLHVRNFVCDVPFQTENIEYREEKEDSGGRTLHWEWKSDIEITRTEQKIEAEIKPGPGFKDRVPTMNSAIPFEARVVSPPGLPVNWKISLYNVSNLPGVCNNADMPPAAEAQWQNQIKKDSYDLIFDFRKYGKTNPPFKPVSEPWQILETSKPVNAVGFSVSCLDYGASGRVLAMARVPGAAVAAIYKETGETFVRIPYSKSKSDKHRIAEAAKPDGSDKPYPSDKPEEDVDDNPNGNGCRGDGLTVFEEYRGFYVRDGDGKFPANAAPVFKRLDPDKKDVFINILNEKTAKLLALYLADFQKSSGLAVHQIGSHKPWLRIDPIKHEANFNRDPRDKPQCAINLAEDSIPDAGVLGDTSPRVGPPRRVLLVTIDSVKSNRYSQAFHIGDMLKNAVIHELGHAVGLWHHGNGNFSKNGLVAIESGQNSGNMDCPMRYSTANFYLHKGSRVPVPYDNSGDYSPVKEFCHSNQGTGRNAKRADGHYYCGDAQFGNCAGQIIVNDRCTNKNPAFPDEDQGETAMLRIATELPQGEGNSEQPDRGVNAEVSVSGGFGKPVVAGESVVLNLHIVPVAPEGQKLQKTLGVAGQRWIDNVSFKIIDAAGKETPLKIRHLGSVQKVSTDPNVAPSTASPEQLKVEPEAIYSTPFAIDGADTEKLSGKFRVVASVPLNDGPLSSDEATFEIKSPRDLPATEQARLETRRILANARVAFADEKFDEAEKLSRDVITKEPLLFEAHLILARSLVRQDKSREAYDEFGKALELRQPPSDRVDEPPYEIMFEMQGLADKLGIKPEPPQIAAGPFTTHSLSAQSATGRLPPPFPKDASQLIFEWQLTAPANDPLGVRWIAEEVGGVEKDHIIATAKSEPNKQSGQFSLSKPTAGFPPGKYRVEIWQAGKMIYSEKFEIKAN